MSEYMTPSEKEIASKVIAAAIAASYTVSVNDGEETTVRKSTDAAVILDAMATTDSDYLVLHKDGKQCGSIWFVYGNEDGVVIADYNVSLEHLLAPINEWAEEKWAG